MNADDLMTTLPRCFALFLIFPLALLLFWFTWKVAAKSYAARTTWSRVTARVAEDDQKQTVTLEFPWKEQLIRRDVNRGEGFSDVSKDQSFPVLVNPARPEEIRQATFGDLWGGSIILAFFALILTGAGIFLICAGSTEPPELAAMAANWEKAVQQAKSQASLPQEQPRTEEDGSLIVMREPGEAWKANIFWGLLFGLLLILPCLFAPKEVPVWKRAGVIAAGLLWMGFMGRSAIQNHGREIACDNRIIRISQPFGSRQIPLREVKKVARRDLRQQFRELNDIGRSSTRPRGLDTMAPMVNYILYNADGQELLRLDKGMEPAGELHRFLDRLARHTGSAIVDE